MSQTPDETAQALVARLGQNPGDRQAYDALRSHYRTTGDHASLVNLVAGWAAYTAVAKEKAEAYLEVAEVLWTTLGDPDRAAEYFRAALAHDPLDTRISDGLQSLWEGCGEYSSLAEFLQSHLRTLDQLGAPQDTVAVLHYRLAEVWNQHLGDSERALHHYLQGLDLDPSLLHAYHEARALCEARGDYARQADLYERELAVESDEGRRAALIAGMARLHRDRLDGPNGAIAALGRCRATAPQDAALADALAAQLSERARTGGPTAEDDRRRAASLLFEAASGQTGAKQVEYLRAVLEHDPTHEQALGALEEQLVGSSEEPELSLHWVAYLAAGAEGDQAYTRRCQLARAYWHAGQQEDARYCLQPAVEAGHPQAATMWAEMADPQAPAVSRPETRTPPTHGTPSKPARSTVEPNVPDAPPGVSGRPAPPRSSR
ncbi:MAG: tetratricopeptide repeat protein, partial [Myxococcales bacterium]|nr:tetratricopeptide repeat protein [Myxococcales bacterium]